MSLYILDRWRSSVAPGVCVTAWRLSLNIFHTGCAVTLRGRKVRLDHAVRVAAYCGTMRDFQKLVVKRVMTAALADSVQHKREKVREKIKQKAGEARASLNEKVKAVNETRAAVRKRIFGAGKEAVPDQAS